MSIPMIRYTLMSPNLRAPAGFRPARLSRAVLRFRSDQKLLRPVAVVWGRSNQSQRRDRRHGVTSMHQVVGRLRVGRGRGSAGVVGLRGWSGGGVGRVA